MVPVVMSAAAAAAAGRRGASATGAALRALATSASAPVPRPGRGPPVTDPKDVVRTPEDLRRMNRTGEESMYKLGKQRSNALELVMQIPPIEVDGEMAVCDGGGGALGHPVEYISLKRPGAVEPCKYCALRYTKKTKK